MDLYINAMKECYKLLKQKAGGKNIFESTDYLCFHTPFYKMIQKAFDSLVKVDKPNTTAQEAASLFLKKVEPSLFVSKRIGNIYTGSLYACLISLLYKIPDIQNKNTLLFSYGSGLCSTMLQAQVISNPLSKSQITDIDNMFNSRIKVSPEEYSKVMKYKEETYGKWRGKIEVDLNLIADNTFYLEAIDDKWRRSYKLKQLQGETLVKNNISAIERINNIDKMIPITQEKSFHKMTINDRREVIQRKLNDSLDHSLLESGGIDSEQGDKIIENVIGKLSLPLGIVPMLLINNQKYMVPMCTEEPSVVAATSSIGKFFAPHSFIASSSPNMMIGQVHLLHVQISEVNKIRERKASMINELNNCCQSMVKRGGGVKDIRIREISDSSNGNFKNYSLDVIINVCDAMGANITNTIAEKAKEIVTFMGIKTGISILSNYCIERTTESKFMIPVEHLSWKGHKGIEVAEKVIEAYQFAKTDMFRAVTHNKGIMNGIDAVCLATGQDWRAIESAAHAYATRKGGYQPLTHYEIVEMEGKKYLMGMLELPVAVGTIGGTITKNDLYRQALKIMGNPSTQVLSEIIVTVGLAQNFAALRAMAIEGIQKGHMKLHVRAIMNIAKVPEHLEVACFRFMSARNKFN
ncbi:uncharacterized protein LOC116244767 [Nymphaea colorata]|nr:uncharacterized protein LOC116244767 [Nymphaea colorata]